MEVTGNIYDDNGQGNSAQGHEEATPQAKNQEAKISSASRWARWIFNTLAILGWILIGILIIDSLWFNSKLIIWIMIGK